MQADRPSSTAEMVCSWRALAQLLPAEERIVEDPYARGFLGPGRARLLDAAERLPPRALRAVFRRMDRVLQGVMSFVLARHRAMDELLLAQEGLEQVVLLGAGYDTRAARLEALRAVPVFEVDHPATAARKARLAPAAFGAASPDQVVRVPVDFQRESLRERLEQAGFRPGRPTFWIWEGVVMYLEEEAVRATLRIIRELSPPGALLTLDSWNPPQDGLVSLAVRDLPRLAMRLVYAEPFLWGPPPTALEPLFREEGFALIEQVSSTELIPRYTGQRRGRFERADHMHWCVAEVERGLEGAEATHCPGDS